MGEAVIESGAACQPNISPAGIRKRRGLGRLGAVLTIATAGGLVALHARWPWSFAVFVPAAFAGVNLLQVHRKTCVLRAAEGTFERDDFSTTPASEESARRSRQVAASINRDSVLIGLGAVALTILATRLA